MKPPIYQPPYDSPIEDAFAKHAEKYLRSNVDLQTQVEVKTICGVFRLDFIAVSNEGVVTGFECDGKEFHEESRDEWRDAMILGTDKVDEIYRITGKDIVYQIEDIFCLISKWSPWLFDERQTHILSRTASEDISSFSILPEESFLLLYFQNEWDKNIQQIKLWKHHKNIPKGKRQFWQSAFDFAQKSGGGNLDNVISEYRK